MPTHKKLLYLLTRHEKRKAMLLLCMILIMAFLEMIGVVSIMPFMAVLTNPDLIQTNPILSNFFSLSKKFGVETNNQFLFALGVSMFLLLTFSISFKALTNYAALRFTYMRQYSLGKRIIEGYLHQPFSWFLNRHSADLGKTLVSEVGHIVNQVLNPSLNLIQNIFITLAILVILYFIAQSGNFNDIIPIIALYVFAGYRLMPALQGIYRSAAQIRYAKPTLDSLYNDLKNLKSIIPVNDENRLQLKKNITLKNIFYQYPNSKKTVINDLNLNISASSRIGIVGATGSGKTTIVDIILGPKSSNRDDALKHFIYDTLPGTIDAASVKAKFLKNLILEHDTIEEIDHKPKLLILDEATSSLDNLTEKDVIDAVHNMGKDLTVVMIAHRLSTVKECDKIVVLENGEIKHQGSFQELTKINDYFRLATSDFKK